MGSSEGRGSWAGMQLSLLEDRGDWVEEKESGGPPCRDGGRSSLWMEG